MNETEDKEDKIICLSSPKKWEKQVKEPVGQPQREKKTKKIMEVVQYFSNLHNLYKMAIDEEFYEHAYVEEFNANYSISKTRKRLFLSKKLEICECYATHKSHRKTVRVFGLQDLTVRDIFTYNPIGGNASNNLKKMNLTTFREIIPLFP